MSTLILVHGAWHGGWCWYKVVPLLQQAGHKAIAVDLPALGRDRTTVRDVSLQSYVDRVCAAMDEQPGRAVLVGHGRGGIVISQTAEQRPARVEKLVYLAAFLLPGGEAMLPWALDDPGSLLLPNLIVNEAQGYITVKEEGYREAMYADCPDADVMLAASLLTPEPIAPLVTPLDLSERNFGRVPRVYIETLCDNAVTLPAQRRMMLAALPCAAVISMNTSHSPFFSAPQELADHLASLACTPAADSQWHERQDVPLPEGPGDLAN
jgi:pimeloyl-ACP methyl ester carboxylesterase